MKFFDQMDRASITCVVRGIMSSYSKWTEAIEVQIKCGLL